jgi:hypothetical protein
LVNGTQSRASREQAAQKKAAELQKKRLAASRRAQLKVEIRRAQEGKTSSEQGKQFAQRISSLKKRFTTGSTQQPARINEEAQDRDTALGVRENLGIVDAAAESGRVDRQTQREEAAIQAEKQARLSRGVPSFISQSKPIGPNVFGEGGSFQQAEEKVAKVSRIVVPEVEAKGPVTGFISGVSEQFREKPLTTAGLFGIGFATRKLPTGVISSTPARITTTSLGAAFVVDTGQEVLNAPTFTEKGQVLGGAGAQLLALGGGSFVGGKVPNVFVGERISIPTAAGPIKSTTIGVQAGSRGFPLLTKTAQSKLPRFGAGKVIEPIPLTEVQGNIAAPVTTAGLKVLNKQLALSNAEGVRLNEIVTSTRLGKSEVGGSAKNFIAEIEGIKNPAKFTRVVEKFSKKRKGKVFGSAVTLRLAKEFQVRPQDLDIEFKTQTIKQLTKDVPVLVKELRSIGEEVRISEKSPLNVESVITGEKILEFKAKDQFKLEEPAPKGGLGFLLSDKAVKFGKTKSTTIGEQFKRKGIASAFFRGADPKAPKGFEGPGIFPKGPRTKDIGDFILTGKGIASRKTSSVRPFRRSRGKKLEQSINKLQETFTQEQQQTINELISSRKLVSTEPLDFKPKFQNVAQDVAVNAFGKPLFVSPSRNVVDAGTGLLLTLPPLKPSKSSAKDPAKSTTPFSSVISRVISPSPRRSRSPDRIKSPSILSPIKSSSILSPPRSPPFLSPPGSPPSKSPPRSPPSLSPPRSPPSKSPPSLPPSIIPPLIGPPISPPTLFRQPRVKKKKKPTKRTGQRKFKFQPSITAKEFRIFSTKIPARLTGLEDRPIIRRRKRKKNS